MPVQKAEGEGGDTSMRSLGTDTLAPRGVSKRPPLAFGGNDTHTVRISTATCADLMLPWGTSDVPMRRSHPFLIAAGE